MAFLLRVMVSFTGALAAVLSLRRALLIAKLLPELNVSRRVGVAIVLLILENKVAITAPFVPLYHVVLV